MRLFSGEMVTPSETPKVAAFYSSSRLRFKRDVIEPLEMNDLFRVDTPHGSFQMTKAEFYRDFKNIVESASYRERGEYHSKNPPKKAQKYLVNSTVEATAQRPRAIPTRDPGVGTPPQAKPPTSTAAWLNELPSPGVRQVFDHLASHGVITETEAAAMLGGQRELRKFAREFESHAARAPFRVRIDVAGGLKRYVREGGEG